MGGFSIEKFLLVGSGPLLSSLLPCGYLFVTKLLRTVTEIRVDHFLNMGGGKLLNESPSRNDICLCCFIVSLAWAIAIEGYRLLECYFKTKNGIYCCNQFYIDCSVSCAISCSKCYCIHYSTYVYIPLACACVSGQSSRASDSSLHNAPLTLYEMRVASKLHDFWRAPRKKVNANM